jgi:hypothetical protein
MSGFTPQLHVLSNARIGALVWPREHGAWGMLLVPLATGAWIGLSSGHRVLSLILFSVAVLALFCLRTPLEAWLETSPFRAHTPLERQVVLYSMMAYASIAAAALGMLFLREQAYGLLPLGAAVGATFLAQALLRKWGRQNRIAAQLIGSLGLTSTAAGAYYVVAGRLDSTALLLWAANWVFAANQIHFVQVRIHSARAATPAEKLARGRGFLIGEALTVLLLALAWRLGILPGLATLAFLPVLIRGVSWFFARPAPLNVHRLGFGELGYALAFGVLFILGFQLPLR